MEAVQYRAPVQAQGVALSEREANGGMHGSMFVKVWGDAGGGDAGREALAKYAYDLGMRAALDQAPQQQAARLHAAAGNLQASGMVVKATFGDHHIIAPIGNANELPIGTKLYAQGLADAKDGAPVAGRTNMPILKSAKSSIPCIRWSVFAGHEKQAMRNHGQTLDRLAERGGLSPCEAVAIIEDRKWHRMDKLAAEARLMELCDQPDAAIERMTGNAGEGAGNG